MLHADANDLKTIFEKQRRHQVPLYQRRYVWDLEKQWEPLWEDVQGTAERYFSGEIPQAHFLGAVVLKQVETASRAMETRLIIDGQQRLTTLQILIASARDVFSLLGPDGQVLKENLNFLLVNQAGLQGKEDAFKVWPTLVDQETFRAVIEAGSPSVFRARSSDVEAPLREAYLYFYDRVDAWLKAGGPDEILDRAKALENTLHRGLVLVVIDLGFEHDAQVIFEALNARGTPLLQSELVKNYLLHMAEEAKEDSKKLHDRYWQPFERSFWQEEVKQGRLYRHRIEIFLQYYMTMQLKREVPAMDLFDTFRGMVGRGPSRSPEDHMVLLAHYGRLFETVSSDDISATDGMFLHRIQVMEVSTLFPLLLFLFNHLDDDERLTERRATLSWLESYLVRRMVCGLTTKHYNKLFLDLLSHIQEEPESSARSTTEFLVEREADSELWPDDDAFRQAWLGEPLYRRITRARLRMILEALEMSCRTTRTEDVSLPARLTIEHLIPREWNQNWPLPEDTQAARDRRAASLHTIGNLTLLTSSLNPALSNGPWPLKKKEIGTHSILKLNNYFQDIDHWDEERIEARGKFLFEHALKLWPRPQ